MEEAFQMLRRFARAQHTGLSDVAHRLASGQLPPGLVLNPGRVDTA